MYQTEVNGKHYELGTSGFLYRSNKLMYDQATMSLWSTLQGEPVVGELVGQGIKLERRHVVTTTWGEWKSRHPDTKVLSLETGHQRDYGEGVAYQEYFDTDQLMFGVPQLDRRLKNKQEVIGLRDGEDQLALSADFLAKRPIWHEKLGETDIVVVTDTTGANRVFGSESTKFISFDGADTLIDEDGKEWKMSESELQSSDDDRLVRIASHRAFWFGWSAQFPDTRLVKE